MNKKFLYDESADEGEICGGIVGVIIVLAIIYYIIMFILSILTQILIVAIIAFVVYRVHSKRNEITEWIQPSIESMTEPEISSVVFLNLFHIAPIHNRYNNKYKKYNGFKNELQNLKKEIWRTSGTIEDYQKKIRICKNRGEPISPATKTEIGILRDKISNETDNKDRLKNQYSNLENLMKKKGDELDKLKKDTHGFIIGHKKGYQEKYEKEEEAWEGEEKKREEERKREELYQKFDEEIEEKLYNTKIFLEEIQRLRETKPSEVKEYKSEVDRMILRLEDNTNPKVSMEKTQELRDKILQSEKDYYSEAFLKYFEGVSNNEREREHIKLRVKYLPDLYPENGPRRNKNWARDRLRQLDKIR